MTCSECSKEFEQKGPGRRRLTCGDKCATARKARVGAEEEAPEQAKAEVPKLEPKAAPKRAPQAEAPEELTGYGVGKGIGGWLAYRLSTKANGTVSILTPKRHGTDFGEAKHRALARIRDALQQEYAHGRLPKGAR